MEIKHMTMKEFKEFNKIDNWHIKQFDLGFKCFNRKDDRLLYNIYINNWNH